MRLATDRSRAPGLTPTTRARTALVAAALAALAPGCAAPPPSIEHDAPELPETEGKRVRTRSDLEPALAAAATERADRLEALLDRTFPWLEAPRSGPVRLVLLADERRFLALARAHEVSASGAPVFACSAGELVARFRAEEWGQGPAGGWLGAPRGAPVAEAFFRRRLEAAFGSALERTWLEEGAAHHFALVAARELGEGQEAARKMRDDLLDAFLPLFLGTDPALARTALARGSSARAQGSKQSVRSSGAPALAYAVARFLLEANGGQRAPWVRTLLEVAAGKAEGSTAEALHEGLSQDEGAFERWLRERTVEALVAALEDEPVPAARWEARSALRLVAGIEVKDDETDPGTPEQRAELLARVRTAAAQRTTVRFLEELDARLRVPGGRFRAGELEQVVKDARARLDARAKGFGHPAIEEARPRLAAAVQARARDLAGGK